jgi:hypothetical protein
MSEQGKYLNSFLPRADETDELYLRRVWDVRPPQFRWHSNDFDREYFPPPPEIQARAEELKASISRMLERIADSLVSQGERFLAAAEDASPERLEALAAKGAPVNYHDPRNGATALHYVAAQGARPALRALLKSGELDFLARDDRGRLASTLAGTYGRDLAMERFLLTKAIRQARESGIPLQQIYRRDAASRSARSPGP